MTTYLLVMLLASGEVVRSEVTFDYCMFYLQNLHKNEVPIIDHQLVTTAICAPKGEVEKALAKVGTQ